ncbi:MAG: GLPGLI family protein [Flavobacteriaceae bacterium]|nr:GLPGLI family protein [Flavobacteriaceae bacterium]
MKNLIQKAFLVLMLLFLNETITAQNISGKAYYESKTTIDTDFGGRQMSEQRRAQIKERMKSAFEKTYVLSFNKSQSLYKEEVALDPNTGAGGRGRFRIIFGGAGGGTQYKDIVKAQLIEERELFGKQFLIKDSLPVLKWKLEKENKQIGQYICFKATAIKRVEITNTFRFGRRNNTENNPSEKSSGQEETSKEIIVTAWYTPQIPLAHGPGEYGGLSGLILELNADRTTILCSKIIINTKETKPIKELTKGKIVSRKAFNKIVNQKTKEMQEQFQRRRGRGDGAFRH